MNNSFVFYESFWNAIRLLPKDERLEAFETICEYALNDYLPDELLPGTEIVFTLVKPQIDANNQRRSNGIKGGRPSKEKPSVKNKKTNGYKNKKPNVNVNVNVNDNANVNANVNENENENENGNVNANGYSCAFEQTWQIYPRKKEKAAAYKAYKARLKDYTEPELDLAARRYAEECRILGTEERYIKHAATFFGPSLPFVDYLADDYRPPEPSRGMNRPRSGTGEKTKEEYLASWGLAPDGRTEI